MSIDQRTRLHRDVRDIPRDEVFESVFAEATARNGELAARGLEYKKLPALGLDVAGRTVTLCARNGRLKTEEGDARAGAVATLDASALSELVQDRKSAMGLAMNAKVEMRRGRLETFIGWEPVFRAYFDARPVHEAGAVDFRDRAGRPLDLSRRFSLDDDREEISHFLHEAGFLHVENVFTQEEMAAVAADLDVALAEARPDDGASWWATDADGVDHAVRVLWFHEKSAALRELLRDDRLQWIPKLSGDDHDGSKIRAEGLIKPLRITKGLSDLPWHKDCGQGMHAYVCSGLTVGISVTGADGQSGALGVVPGSHRANVQSSGIDPSLDLAPRKLETRTGDITVHCSDTLHRAHPPKVRQRKVVYTGFGMRPKPGDVVPAATRDEERAARARLTSVEDRISEADRSAKGSK